MSRLLVQFMARFTRYL